jgi:hypothetical protein
VITVALSGAGTNVGFLKFLISLFVVLMVGDCDNCLLKFPEDGSRRFLLQFGM